MSAITHQLVLFFLLISEACSTYNTIIFWTRIRSTVFIQSKLIALITEHFKLICWFLILVILYVGYRVGVI